MEDRFATRFGLSPSIGKIGFDYIQCSYDAFNYEGFLVLKDYFLNPPSIDALDSGAFYEVMEKDGSAVRTHLNVTSDKSIAAIEKDLLDFVPFIFGAEFYTHQSRINYKRGFGADGWHWHSDFETWHAQDGMPNPACLTAMVPLTENTNENGALMVMPGSHLYYYSAPKGVTAGALENFTDQRDGVPTPDALRQLSDLEDVGPTTTLLCKPGDLVLFHSNLMHCSNPNRTSGPRSNLFFVLNSASNQLVAPFTGEAPRPSVMAHRS